MYFLEPLLHTNLLAYVNDSDNLAFPIISDCLLWEEKHSAMTARKAGMHHPLTTENKQHFNAGQSFKRLSDNAYNKEGAPKYLVTCKQEKGSILCL